jgi:hypothetical protein
MYRSSLAILMRENTRRVLWAHNHDLLEPHEDTPEAREN